MRIERLFSRPALLLAGGLTTVLCPLLMLGLDRRVANWARDIDTLRGPFFRVITQFGDALYPIAAALLILLLTRTAWGQGHHPLARWIQQTRQFFKFLLLNVVVSGLLVNLLKIGFGRSRPKLLFAGGDYGFHFLELSAARWSFPSGHSNTAMVIGLTMTLFYKRWGWLALIPALLAGFSRIALLQHYPSDVVAGAFVALLTTVLIKDQVFVDKSAH